MKTETSDWLEQMKEVIYHTRPSDWLILIKFEILDYQMGAEACDWFVQLKEEIR